jgi:hypothetical protein
MNSIRRVLLAIIVVLLPVVSQAAPVGKPFDLQGFVDKAVQAGQKKIVIPPGKYRVTPHNHEHLRLAGLHGVTIVADNVEMICTQTTRAISIDKCEGLTVRGLKIDYDPLPFTQGKITALSADKKITDIEIFSGYPAADRATNFKYEIYRPDTRTLRRDDCNVAKVEAVDAMHLRVTKGAGSADDPEQIGDIIVIGAEYAPDGSIPHAVTLDYSTGTSLENVTVFASNCFGFIEFGCSGSVYSHCRIDRCPPAEDIARRSDPRIRSLDADAYHSGGAAKGPSYLNCSAKFMGDDCVNIHGSYNMVTSREGSVLRVLVKDDIYVPGEPVELLTYSGERLPDAVVTKVEPDGKITDAEREFLSKQQMDAGLRTQWTPNAYKVTLDRNTDLPMGSLICSSRRTGNGFAVKNCDFGFNRSRGILIKASNGEVSGNQISGSWMEAILVCPEYWWLESGSSNNVVIKNNIITDCRRSAITVTASGGTGAIAPAGAHRNITISGNKVIGSPLPSIKVTSTDKLVIVGNITVRASASQNTDYLQWLSSRQTGEALVTMDCAHVTSKGNVVR